MDRVRQRIRERVLALYPAVAPAWSQVGFEIECFVTDVLRPERSWGWHVEQQRRIRAEILPATPTIAGLDLEPGAQWELQSVPLGGLDAVRQLADDVTTVAGALRSAGCEVHFTGLRPEGARERLVSPEHRHALLHRYLVSRGRHACAMMADTASMQITLDPHPFSWTLDLLRRVTRAGAFDTCWNPRIPGLSRAGVWREVDPERTIPPAGLTSGQWSDEACLDALLRLPSICARVDAGTSVAWVGDFYEWVDVHSHALDDFERHYLAFLKQIYWPVKPRMKPEIRVLDSRPPAGFAGAIDFLASVGVALDAEPVRITA